MPRAPASFSGLVNVVQVIQSCGTTSHIMEVAEAILPVQSVGRAMKILECLASAAVAGEALPLAAVAEHLGVAPTTAHNLVKTLGLLGYIEKEPRGYRLGPRCAELARARGLDERLRLAGREVLPAVAERTGESVVLATLLNGARRVVRRAEGRAPVRVDPRFERPDDLYAMVTGRVLVAYASEAERAEIVAKQGWPGEAWDQIASAVELESAVQEVRDLGRAEAVTGGGDITALAVPVLDRDGRLLASLGLYLPTFRADEERLEGLREELTAAAERLGAG